MASPSESLAASASSSPNTVQTTSYATAASLKPRPRKDQAVLIEYIQGYSPDDYLDGIEKLVNENDIAYISKITENRVCVFFNNSDIAASLVMEKVQVADHFLDMKAQACALVSNGSQGESQMQQSPVTATTKPVQNQINRDRDGLVLSMKRPFDSTSSSLDAALSPSEIKGGQMLPPNEPALKQRQPSLKKEKEHGGAKTLEIFFWPTPTGASDVIGVIEEVYQNTSESSIKSSLTRLKKRLERIVLGIATDNTDSDSSDK
ncbi:hypothetical protein QAD02_004117 [Eretmocerus hayati]|uniref:Uncharacterized protein n=1 Tax=Eretmocerus hayati TaxID=131215 RepID=A0ACC2NP25_9HYME|nr:hypothetical protein QAD02_004117 [Eretmocerus hayati]